MVHTMAAALLLLALQIAGSTCSEEDTTDAIGTPSSNQSSATVHVPDGYTLFHDVGYAYKYFSLDLTWDLARKHCIAEGGNLAVVDSMDTLKYANQVSRDDPSGPFLGVHRLFDSPNWFDLSNDLRLTFVPWSETAEVNGEDARCGSLLPDGTGVISTSCNLPGPHICEVSLTQDEPVQGLDITDVPTGYTVFPHLGVAYKLFETPLPWAESQEFCIGEGGNLPVIDSWEKVEIINDLTPANRHPAVGIHRQFNNSEWIDIVNGLPVDTIPWRNISDVEDKDRNCAAATDFEGDHGLFAIECSVAGWFMCELSISTDSAKP